MEKKKISNCTTATTTSTNTYALPMKVVKAFSRLRAENIELRSKLKEQERRGEKKKDVISIDK